MLKFYRRFVVVIIIPIIAAAFPFFVFASNIDTKAYDWYFKAESENKQPTLIPEADFINDYDIISMGDPDQKTLYLTFDAGYDNGFHTQILDTLKQKNVTAAFFVDGNFLNKNPDLVKRMAAEGHLVCNHSKSHPDMTKLTDFEDYSKQITEWNESVKSLGLTPNNYFRFPMGRFSRRALEYNKTLGVKSVFWSFAYYDWDNDKQPTATAACEKIYSRIHNGCVMLLHSTSATNAAVLPQVIDKLTADGYTFKSLDEFKK